MIYVCAGTGIVVIILLVLFALGLCRIAANEDDKMGIR